MRPALLLCLLGIAAFGQAPEEKPKLDPEIAALLDAARAVAPEYTADILLRVLASDRVPEPELRNELYEELFDLGSLVEHSMSLLAVEPRTKAPWRTPQSAALASGLDGLSIQCQAVRGALASDPQLARRLFERIVEPAPAPATCSDRTVPTPVIYYETAVEGFPHWFTPQEKERSIHLTFLLDRLQRISSPIELAAAADFLLDTNPTRSELEALIGAYTGALAQLSHSHREMTISAHSLAQALTKIVRAARESAIPEGPLLAGARRYFVDRMTGDVCAPGPDSQRDTHRVEQAIKSLIELGAVEDVQMFPPLKEREATPRKVLEPPEGDRFERSEGAASILAKARMLRRDVARTDIGRESHLRQMADQLMLDLDSWEPSPGDDPYEHFHTKALSYTGIPFALPADPIKERAIRSSLAFLAVSPIQHKSPVHFLVCLREVLGVALLAARQRSTIDQSSVPQDVEPALVLAAMRRSSSAVMALYGTAESLIPELKGK